MAPCLLLPLDPGAVDAYPVARQYRTVCVAAARAPHRAHALVLQPLDRGRAPPLGVLAHKEVPRPEAVRLEELRIDAMELFLEATVVTRRPELAVPALRAAVTDHPYRERLWFLLMTALSREGRRVEALRAFQDAKIVLGEAGLEPAIDLRELEQEIYEESEDVRSRF